MLDRFVLSLCELLNLLVCKLPQILVSKSLRRDVQIVPSLFWPDLLISRCSYYSGHYNQNEREMSFNLISMKTAKIIIMRLLRKKKLTKTGSSNPNPY